jgi:hypothetical protein
MRTFREHLFHENTMQKNCNGFVFLYEEKQIIAALRAWLLDAKIEVLEDSDKVEFVLGILYNELRKPHDRIVPANKSKV